jgi:hypothetical protein
MNINDAMIMKSTSSRHGLACAVPFYRIASILIFLGLPCLLPAQTLEHRYSFVSDASDSVGGPAWNGTLQPPNGGTAATISDGLTLPGGGGPGFSGYVTLPAAILTNTSSITVECWVTQNSANGWAEVWNFNNGQSEYIGFIPDPENNNHNMSFAVRDGTEYDAFSPDSFPSGSEQYVAATFDASTLVGDLYTNGVLIASVTAPNDTYIPGTYGGAGGTLNNYLGQDPFPDPQFQGTIYEFRIWNGVIPQRQMSASTLLGPSVLLTNLTPTSVSITAGSSVVLTGTEQADVTVLLSQTGTTNLEATGDATNWVSGNTNVLTVNSSGLISGVGLGNTTISAKVGGIAATTALITVTPVALEHRYSFVSDASDSVGGPSWDGTLQPPSTGNAATISNGLSLPGNTTGGYGYSGYVSFPSGILVGYSSLTIECWATENQRNTWAELWDFGNSGSQNFGLIPASPTPNTRVAFTPNGGEIDIDTAPMPTNSEQYIVVTYDNSTLTGDLFSNGALDSVQTFPNTSYSPGSIGGANGTDENMLGNDVYGDYQFDGTVYEFRIWLGAVSPLYIAASAVAGPSVIITNTTVESLAVTVPTNSIVGTQTEQATATANFLQASSVLVTSAVTNWSSSDTNILTVSASGLITGISGGSATVTAKVGGVSATSPSITVAVTKPVFTEEPAPETEAAGDSVTFTATAVGGDLSYQWYDGGTLIQGATNDTLTLTDLALGQAGNYSVVVSNALGVVTSTVVALTVDTAILQHRYSFVADASDSVGNANGTLIAGNNSATINDGLSLPGTGTSGNPSGYVSLPNDILAGDDSVTIECWVTQNQQNEWAEIWSFGVAGGSVNFGLIPDSNTGNMRVAFTPNGGEVDINAPAGLATGSEQYVAVTYNNSDTTGNLFLNGALYASTTFPNASYSPGTFNTSEDVLGLDPFGGDDQFNGTIYELRIWNGVIPQRQIAASAVLGPTVLVTNLTPTSASLTAGSSVVLTGTEQAEVDIQLAQTGATNLEATADATNWVSGNTNILTVNSSGVISGVGLGSTTVSATVAGVSATSGLITVTPVALAHRYSFVSDASDSVSNADGTLVAPSTGAAATISNGLVLPGNRNGGYGYSGYVSLPSGLLVGFTSLTVECWVTENQPNTWAELWDFGNNGSQNFGMIPAPANNNGNLEVAFTPNGGEVDLQSDSLFPTNAEQYVVVTYDNSTLTGNLYTNGLLDATRVFPNSSYSPGSIGGVNGTDENALGNDVYGDYQFDGTVYEFRIWLGAVSPLYIAVSAAAGPSVLVTDLTPSLLTVTVPANSIVGGQAEQATALGNFTVASGVNVTGGVTNWTSSDTNVLTVSSSGLVTGVANGSATVSATAGGVTGTSASISVTPLTVEIATSGTNLVLSWPAGVLRSAPTVLGPWTTVTSATSPYTVAPTNGASEFFKIEINP